MIRSLLKAFDNVDPATNRQKAVTPKFLQALHHYAHTAFADSSPYRHASDILIGAYFFAMRSCEHSKTTSPGKTLILVVKYVIFRSRRRRLIPHNSGNIHLAYFVTIIFVDQKNGKKMDARTQRRTDHKILCPVRRWAAVVSRVRTTVPHCSDDTPVCSVRNGKTTLHISQTFLLTFLRSACAALGGHQAFGFHPHEIGNKSIRSGAAMALFLANHSPAKIMILGRWSSDAFLVYIRPQVLEWTNNMSVDMIRLEAFLDVSFDMAASDDPRTRTLLSKPLNGREQLFTLPKFHLHH
jgi:hypothetical protein